MNDWLAALQYICKDIFIPEIKAIIVNVTKGGFVIFWIVLFLTWKA